MPGYTIVHGSSVTDRDIPIRRRSGRRANLEPVVRDRPTARCSKWRGHSAIHSESIAAAGKAGVQPDRPLITVAMHAEGSNQAAAEVERQLDDLGVGRVEREDPPSVGIEMHHRQSPRGPIHRDLVASMRACFAPVNQVRLRDDETWCRRRFLLVLRPTPGRTRGRRGIMDPGGGGRTGRGTGTGVRSGYRVWRWPSRR